VSLPSFFTPFTSIGIFDQIVNDNGSSSSIVTQQSSSSITSIPSFDFLVQDFAVIMIVAAVMLFITFKLKQPMVIGYIIAGMVIGPFTPPFTLIHSVETVNAFAELGIIMLLFVIGTDFPINKLRSVGKISLVVALAESMGTLLIVYIVAQLLGFSFYDSLFIALALSVTSTVVTIKILEELHMIKDKSTTLLLGISIVEDIIVITALGVLQSIASDTGGEISIPSIAVSLGIVGAFIGGTLFLGSRFIPNIVDRISRVNDYALLLIVILGLAFGLSFIAKSLGLSVATGAFLAGVLVAESKTAPVARVITTPLRDVFAALFFISIGALMDISLIPFFIVPALILIAASFSSKFLIVSAILAKANYDKSTALRTGMGMASARGELTLVVAKVGQDIGAISSAVFPTLGVITIITTFMTPYVLKLGKKLKFKSTDVSSEVDKSPSSPSSSPSSDSLSSSSLSPSSSIDFPSSSLQEQEEGYDDKKKELHS
jgi:CPA2 family monovalent cation:H+ antiporter-2